MKETKVDVKQTKVDVKEIIDKMDIRERLYSLNIVLIACRSSQLDRRQVPTGPPSMAISA